MSAEERAHSFIEPTRLALEYALELLEESARKAVIDTLESKYTLSLYHNAGELSRDEVETALQAFFSSGATLFMQRFDEYLKSHTADFAAN